MSLHVSSCDLAETRDFGFHLDTPQDQDKEEDTDMEKGMEDGGEIAEATEDICSRGKSNKISSKL